MLTGILKSMAMAVAASATFAQSPAARPAFDSFEVATIKPMDPNSLGRYIRMQSTNRFYAKGFTLQALVAAAYSLTPRAISGGAAWTDADRYDILASTPGDVQPNLDEQMSMLRKLLADRFQLTFHREPKELPVYALTLAKGGPKLKESTAPAGELPYLINTIYPEEKGGVHALLPARNATMAQFTAMLQRGVLDRMVLDNTGLSGKYDFELEWTPDDNQFGGQLPRSAEPTKPNLFTALQEQLGLKLEATKGVVAALVIERAERPSEN
jgi:uncharacterized protein (TIGR03435 family)